MANFSTLQKYLRAHEQLAHELKKNCEYKIHECE